MEKAGGLREGEEGNIDERTCDRSSCMPNHPHLEPCIHSCTPSHISAHLIEDDEGPETDEPLQGWWDSLRREGKINNVSVHVLGCPEAISYKGKDGRGEEQGRTQQRRREWRRESRGRREWRKGEQRRRE